MVMKMQKFPSQEISKSSINLNSSVDDQTTEWSPKLSEKKTQKNLPPLNISSDNHPKKIDIKPKKIKFKKYQIQTNIADM